MLSHLKTVSGFNVARAVAVIHPADHVESEWIALCLRSPLSQHLLGSRANTTVQTTINLKDLRALPIPLPPVNERREAASVMSALDDRITLLRETNATLEAIAQALFKSWFVDFDPVHAKAEGRQPEGMDAPNAALFPDSFEESELGLVPKGWVAAKMTDISTVGIGKTPPRKESQWFSEDARDVRWVSIRDMGTAGVYANQTSEFLTSEAVEKFNVRRVPDNTVLMLRRRPGATRWRSRASRHARYRTGAKGARCIVRARPVAHHPGRPAGCKTDGAGKNRRLLDRAGAVPVAGDAHRLAHRQIPGLSACTQRHRRGKSGHAQGAARHCRSRAACAWLDWRIRGDAIRRVHSAFLPDGPGGWPDRGTQGHGGQAAATGLSAKRQFVSQLPPPDRGSAGA
ncbi:restriction modification system DNA specificity protein-containing protein [Stutzerimonas stutzeri TS44]|nr:restriction modification system DNA specificity protein-containing protein [Stutzerimonas stutzeri TS44]